MAKNSRQILLELYANPQAQGNFSRRDYFPLIVAVSLFLFTCAGIYLYRNVPPPKSIEEKITQITTRFIMDEKPAEAIKKPVKEIKKAEPPKEKEIIQPKDPIDLTNKPVLDQPQNDIQQQPQQSVPEEPKVVRRVYGLKRVYSTGIGSGGSAADAVIGKIGNTLKTDIDTFTATKEELKGKVISITTVTSLPKFKFIVKPEYTKEMVENKIEGVIKVRVLVDVDGKVKKAIVLNDLGFGSKEKVLETCLKFEFEPAKINGTPCAVWFVIPITFKMLG